MRLSLSSLPWKGLAAGLLSAMALSAGAAESTLEADNTVFSDVYPKHFDSWESTADSDKIIDVLSEDPRLVILWAGYGFAKDYNAARGHMYAVTDVRNTLRTGAPKNAEDGPMPMACWSCKSPDVPRLMEEKGDPEFYKGKWASGGPEIVNPIGCVDCHNNKDGGMQLALSRPYLPKALKAMGEDPEKATKKDMNTLVCAQCHTEYYFEEKNKAVQFPWDKGTKAEDIEAYFDEIEFADWIHPISKTPMLKAQHPDYETWKEGLHSKMGLACADCHMPTRDDKKGAFTDHRILSTTSEMMPTCKNCHNQSEEELVKRVKTQKDMITELKLKVEDELVKAHIEAGAAWKAGAGKEEMRKAINNIRHAQWRWDYSIASHGIQMHAPDEAMRVLKTAMEKATEARKQIAAVLKKHGVTEPVAIPDISTEEKAQAYLKMDMEKMKKEKAEFLKNTVPQWEKEAKEAGRLSE